MRGPRSIPWPFRITKTVDPSWPMTASGSGSRVTNEAMVSPANTERLEAIDEFTRPFSQAIRKREGGHAEVGPHEAHRAPLAFQAKDLRSETLEERNC